MNLFRNPNKKFEDQLHKRLEDLDYRPSESLWDKLASELPEDGFESSVSRIVNTYEPKPSPETWEQLEAQLPLEHSSKSYRRFFWIPLLLLFTGVAAYLGYELNQQEQPVAMNEPAAPVSPKQESIEAQPTGTITAPQEKRTVNGAQQAQASIEHADASPVKTPVQEINAGEAAPVQQKEKLAVIDQPVAASEPVPQPATHASNKATAEIFPGKPLPQPVAGGMSHTKPVVRKHAGKQEQAPVIADRTKNDVVKPNMVDQAQKSTAPIITEPVILAGSKQQLPQEATTINTPAPVQELAKAEQEPAKNNAPAKPDAPAANGTQQPEQPPLANNGTKPVDESAAPVAQGNSEKKTDETELTRFSISVITGVQYCFNQLSAPSHGSVDFGNNIALRRKLETPALDWNGAFLLDYTLNKRWRISAGLMISNFSQSFDYAVVPASAAHASNEPGATVQNPNDSIISGSAYSNRIKYTWTEIPVFITYSLPHKGRFGLDLAAGVSYGIITGVDASYVSYDNVGLLTVKDKSSFPGVKNNFFAHFNPAVTYKATDLISIGLAPTFKYSITSITGNEAWVQQRPYFMGLSLSLRKQF